MSLFQGLKRLFFAINQIDLKYGIKLDEEETAGGNCINENFFGRSR